MRRHAPAGGKTRAQAGAASYNTRRIRNEYDSALGDYTDAAPSRRQRTEWDAMAEALHAWDGSGPPPFDLAEAPCRGGLRWILPLARFVSTGEAPAHYDEIYVDEAQDMGACELTATLRLLKPTGRLVCYGDPGQAIFAGSKGLAGDQLPAAWRLPGERRLKEGGHRVGQPAAEAAARVLRPLWDRPAASFAAPLHLTPVVTWDAKAPPARGLVLGYSRYMVDKYLRDWALRDVAVVPSTGCLNTGLVLCTGHAAKGVEAGEVYLLPWAKKALARLDAGDPGALRLLYVMLTRARHRVYVPDQLGARIGA